MRIEAIDLIVIIAKEARLVSELDEQPADGLSVVRKPGHW
jgi:hypothetical protein